MWLRFDREERKSIAERLMELGNLSIIALFLGQFLSRKVESQAAMIGLAVFLVGYTVAFMLMKGGGHQ